MKKSKKDHKNKGKLTDDQIKSLVEGAQFAYGGDDVDRLFDEIEKILVAEEETNEKSHAE